MIYYRCLFLIIIKMNFISSQICRNDIPDFFYNVDFSGPFFDQAVYTKIDFPVSTPNHSSVFNFTLAPQTDYTRPSYFHPTKFSSRTLNFRSEDFTVRSSDPNFVVEESNSVYTLYTNTYPLKYFLPFNRYLFNLTAEQRFPGQNRPPTISTAIVQINLQNDNVHSPIFTPENQTFYISETAPPDTQFGTVYAMDPDNDGIKYSVTDTRFSIDQTTGVLRLKRVFLSIPSEEYVDINVTATDDGSSCLSDSLCRENSNSINVRVIVTAVNRKSPTFLSDICGKEISLRENNNIKEPIISLTVWDEDRGENGIINISFPSKQLLTVNGLQNIAYSQFYLESMEQINTTRTTILKTNETFDYDKPDTPRVWFLYILATDNGKPQRQTFCTLRINLIDVNDNAPVFIMPSWNYTIYSSSNNRFLRIIAFDADSDSNGRINYYIGTRDVPYFSIERETGIIMLRDDTANIASLNISRFPIIFEVYAQDLGRPPRSSADNATVTIYYSNSGGPVPARWLDNSDKELHINISEKFYELHPNQPINQNGVYNGSIYYESTSNMHSPVIVKSPFSYYTDLPFSTTYPIQNGIQFKSDIIITRSVDAKIQDNYFLYISVVDPPLISSIRIKLIDENDQPPTLDIHSIVLSVLENESGYRILGQIQAFDRDIDPKYNRVLYTLNKALTDNRTSTRFDVHPNGTIWTNTTFVKEYNQAAYRLFITAFNEEPKWNSMENLTLDFQLDVQVISVNNNKPIFVNESLLNMISINETTKNGMNIRNITIIDADIDTDLNLGILNGNIRNAFTFTLLSTNLDNSSRTQYQAIGQLKVVGPLDYESIKNYTLVLFAFDANNLTTIDVTVYLEPENTKAPVFDLMPGFLAYEYRAIENTLHPVLNGPRIQAIDPDSNSLLSYEIYDPRRQLNLANLNLSKTNNYFTLGINAPGLNRDLPFGSSEYRFAIRAIDENGKGVSSYAQVSIEVNDTNNRAPIPTNFSCIPEGINSKISITFEDYDDPTASNTIPYIITVVPPSNLTLLGPTLSSIRTHDFLYNGPLNRTLTKNFTVTFNTSDNNRYFGLTTISIIVCDGSNIYPISDGSKTIKVIYVKDYQNSLRDVDLGSIYVQDLNDWYRADRTYSIRSVSNEQSFNILQGFLRTSNVLHPGFSTILVDVTKPTGSSALSTIHLEVESIDSEYVRNALTIRIQGEYPETILGHPLDKLHRTLASVLNINNYSIIILSIRSVFQYRNPYDPPIPLERRKMEALTDVIFHVISGNKFEIERKLKEKLSQIQSDSQMQVVAVGADPCGNYNCPIDTHCRATRTIQPKPYTIDTNQTSFVGINILDSADCVYLSNSAANDLLPSSILGLTFTGNGDGYAVYDGAKFSNVAPTRFSFDFVVQSVPRNALILFYGGNSSLAMNVFWIAIDIYQSKLRFHFQNTPFIANVTELNNSTWYHIECQFIHSTILLSINDCQYLIQVNNTINEYDSSVKLYLGGLPMEGSFLSFLDPSLISTNHFIGCIRNVVSNGYYLNTPDGLLSDYSKPGECPCTVTDSCAEMRLSNIIVPWYTWLTMALVFLLLAMILALTLLGCMRRRQQLKTLKGFYTDDTRDSIIDYKDTAGEEDHSTYNLRVLKKPIYTLSDGSIISNNVVRSDYTDSRFYYRPSLGEFIEEKLNKYVIPYADDTQLHYHYEGDGSIASNLSSIESPSVPNENEYQYLQSLGPRFSTVADLYADI